jgi:hypothetical protein
MAWLGRLFGTDKAIENVLDKDGGLLVKAGSWLGGLHYTEEEKAEADTQTREWGIRQLDALAPFKVMQRIMVTIIMVQWLIICNVMIAAICFDAVEIIKNLVLFIQSPFVWVPVSGAVGLYLMGGVIPSRSK